MVADTAMLRGPATLGGPARTTIKYIVGKKCERFISFNKKYLALLLGLGLFHFSCNFVCARKQVYLIESYTTGRTLNAILGASLAYSFCL